MYFINVCVCPFVSTALIAHKYNEYFLSEFEGSFLKKAISMKHQKSVMQYFLPSFESVPEKFYLRFSKLEIQYNESL